MINLIKKMIGDKKEYKEQMTRVQALPDEYRFVFEKLQEYMWRFAGGDGSEMLTAQGELLALFENGATEGRHVLDITGEDVVGFCDEYLRDTKKWSDSYRKKLNEEMNNLVNNGHNKNNN